MTKLCEEIRELIRKDVRGKATRVQRAMIRGHLDFCEKCAEYLWDAIQEAKRTGEYVSKVPKDYDAKKVALEDLRRFEANISPFTWDYIKRRLEEGSQWAKWKVEEMKEKLRELASAWPALQPELAPTRGGRIRVICAKLLDREMRDIGEIIRLKMIKEASFANGIFQCELETLRSDLEGYTVYLTIHHEEEKITFTSKFVGRIARFDEDGFEDIPSSQVPTGNLSVVIVKPE